MDPETGIGTGEMIVKRVSVPVGLEELMEGLVKEVLVRKPDDIYLFAAKYFSQLLTHRDRGQLKVKTMSSAQSLKDQREKRFHTKIPVQSATKQLSRQFSIRGESPNKKLESPIISQKPRLFNRNEPKNKRKNAGPQTILENQSLVARKQLSRSVSNERSRDITVRKEPKKNDSPRSPMKDRSGSRKNAIGIQEKINELGVDTVADEANKDETNTLNDGGTVSSKVDSVVNSQSFEVEENTKYLEIGVTKSQIDDSNEDVSIVSMQSIDQKESKNTSDVTKGNEDNNDHKSIGETKTALQVDSAEAFISENLGGGAKSHEKSGDQEQEKSPDEFDTLDKNIQKEGDYIIAKQHDETISSKTDIIENGKVVDNKLEKTYEKCEKEVQQVRSEENEEISMDKMTKDVDKEARSDQSVTSNEETHKQTGENIIHNGLEKKNKPDVSHIEEITGQSMSAEPAKENVNVVDEKQGVIDKSNEQPRGKTLVSAEDNEEDLIGKEETEQKPDISNKKSNINMLLNCNGDSANDHISISQTPAPVHIKKNKNIDIEEPEKLVADNVLTSNSPKVGEIEDNEIAKDSSERADQLGYISSETNDLISEEKSSNRTEDHNKSDEEIAVEKAIVPEKVRQIEGSILAKDLSKTADLISEEKSNNGSEYHIKSEEGIAVGKAIEPEGAGEIEDNILAKDSSKTADQLGSISLGTNNLISEEESSIPCGDHKRSEEENDVENPSEKSDIQRHNQEDKKGQFTDHNLYDLKDPLNKNQNVAEKTESSSGDEIHSSVLSEVKSEGKDQNEDDVGIKDEPIAIEKYLETSNPYGQISELSTEANIEKVNDSNDCRSGKHNTSTISNHNVESSEDSVPKIIGNVNQASSDSTFPKSSAQSHVIREASRNSDGQTDDIEAKSTAEIEMKNAIRNREDEELKIKHFSEVPNQNEVEINNKNNASGERDVPMLITEDQEEKTTHAEITGTQDVNTSPEKVIEKSNSIGSDPISEITNNISESTTSKEYKTPDDMKTKPADDEDKSKMVNKLNEAMVETKSSSKNINFSNEKGGSEDIESDKTTEAIQDISTSTGNIDHTTNSGEKNENVTKYTPSTNTIKPNSAMDKFDNIDTMNEKLTGNDSTGLQIRNDIVESTVVGNTFNDVNGSLSQNDDPENILIAQKTGDKTEITPSSDIRDKKIPDEEPFVKKIHSTVKEDVPNAIKNNGVDGISVMKTMITNKESETELKEKMRTDDQIGSVTKIRENNITSSEDPSLSDITKKLILQEQSESEGYISKSNSLPENSEIVDRVAKNYVNYVIDKKKNTVPATENDGDNNVDDQTSENEGHITNARQSEDGQVSEDNAAQKNSETAVASVSQEVPSKTISKSTNSFDGSKLREELQKVEEESKLTTFKPTFNPFFLRQEIEDASLHETSPSDNKKNDESESYKGLGNATAVLKIQSIWRGYIVRKRFSKPDMKRDENSNVLKDKNHVISAGNHETSSGDILHAVITIQRLWRGYRTRRNLKNFNSRSKTHAGGNLDSDAMVSAVIIQKMWRGFKARKLMKMQKSSDAHAFPKQISSAIDKDHHDALIDKSFGTDTKEHTEMNTLLDEILDYPVIEEQHLIDTYQNKLLDKISGKDVNEDLEVYKALTSKRVEELESDVEKDLDTIHTSLSSKPQGVKPKLESLAEEPTDENESSKLYTFCSVPSPIPCDSKVVEGKPLSDLVETIDKKGEDTVEKALQHSTSDNQLTENVQSSNAPSRSVSLDTKSEDSKENNAKLLHTGELHDSLVLPLPRGVTESLKHKSDGTIAAEIKTKDEVADMLSNAGLLHSGEFHDSIVLPFSIAKMKNLKVSEVSSDAVPVVSANLENNTGPVGVQVLQAPAPGAVTSARAGSRVNCEAHAQQSDVFPPAAIDGKPGKRLSASMGSGDGQATAQQDISMESEAARKIQAGFRGYQVRKQLKLKNGSSDMSNSRRQMRPKSSQKESGKSSSKPKEIEEKSAVKIQAGVRGFLVRRRQKKQINQ